MTRPATLRQAEIARAIKAAATAANGGRIVLEIEGGKIRVIVNETKPVEHAGGNVL